MLGTINPIPEIARMAHDAGALLVVDGAQSGPKLELDMAELGADFYAVTAHKMYGPTGSGRSSAAASCSRRCRHSSAAAR